MQMQGFGTCGENRNHTAGNNAECCQSNQTRCSPILRVEPAGLLNLIRSVGTKRIRVQPRMSTGWGRFRRSMFPDQLAAWAVRPGGFFELPKCLGKGPLWSTQLGDMYGTIACYSKRKYHELKTHGPHKSQCTLGRTQLCLSSIDTGPHTFILILDLIKRLGPRIPRTLYVLHIQPFFSSTSIWTF